VGVRAFKKGTAQVVFVTGNDKHRGGDGFVGVPALKTTEHDSRVGPVVCVGQGG
jgi:hypothetical protein